MPDHAVSSDPEVQRQLDRLMALSPGADILGLERISQLLDRLGNPQDRLPPVFHVAGTNGKGSTCAFLRAALEAEGYRVHVYSSPHLVRFNERIRLAGTLIADDALATLLAEVLDAAERDGNIGASFFEVTTAAALLAFSRVPADACVIEVGLGGRLDATNVIPGPAVTGIAQLGVDHEAFLGNLPEGIGAEKAGIARQGVPMVTMAYNATVAARVAEVCAEKGAPLYAEGTNWRYAAHDNGVTYSDAKGSMNLPLPALAGPHQAGNLALATAMLRHQTALAMSLESLARGAREALWPARMQLLDRGPLTAPLPDEMPVWLDGGHNQAAGSAIANSLRGIAETPEGRRPVLLILGMLANKDVSGLLEPLAPLASGLIGVPVPGHAHHAPEALARKAGQAGIGFAATAPDVSSALHIAKVHRDSSKLPPIILIAGSLYLAGLVLEANRQFPQ
ncbi:bifunctional folylpolyglutamate synthase/dihydrofolate synthase [Stakelama tenebrarum]|uniref:tetrahydrofolate synthase n=1 Tax=Stakelama tenebrarum TaxID=2711215 RepID=A0A6G6Y658_9SPHN|nr:folylpolyglutamate synthase/dihydrofolate synthase family protein [Sphingosinithalassobacter tenebrarum]QIG80331.1 bifunctional folylpolyglutamate synthase/dihydrofolate synthase [Sphingosinithalassobacter tenebrarum]